MRFQSYFTKPNAVNSDSVIKCVCTFLAQPSAFQIFPLYIEGEKRRRRESLSQNQIHFNISIEKPNSLVHVGKTKNFRIKKEANKIPLILVSAE